MSTCNGWKTTNYLRERITIWNLLGGRVRGRPRHNWMNDIKHDMIRKALKERDREESFGANKSVDMINNINLVNDSAIHVFCRG